MKKSLIGRLLPIILCSILSFSALLSGCQAINAEVAATDAPVKATSTTQTNVAAGVVIPANSGKYTVALDVNPSVELTVENGVVTKVTAYNDDAKQLLLKIDVTGLEVSDATKKLVEALAAEGYINNTEIKPFLLISVYDTNQSSHSLSDSLKDMAKKALDTLDIRCNIVTTAVPSDIPSKAEALGVSIGRYMLFDFIAKKEGITIEQAATKYGMLKVAELIRLYDDADEIFKKDDKEDSNDKSESDEPENATQLTPEQQAAVDAAQAKYLTAIKVAEEAYVKAKAAAINDMKTKWEALKAQYADKNDPAFKQAKKTLREEYVSIRRQIHDTFKQAVQSAENEFETAVSGLGLTEEQVDKLLDYKVSGDFCDDSDCYLKDDDSSEKDNDADEGTATQLTPDQQAAMDAARIKYLSAVKTAEEAYLKAKAAAISDMKTKWEALKAQYAKKNDSTFKQAKKTLREEYKAIRRQIHDLFKQTVQTAQNEFKAAVSGLELTEEQLDKLLDCKVIGDISNDDADEQVEDLKDLLNADDKQDEGSEKGHNEDVKNSRHKPNHDGGENQGDNDER